MAYEKKILERIYAAHDKMQRSRVELGLILKEINDDMTSGKMDIMKHVGLPGTRSIWNEIGVPLYLVGSFSDFERVFEEMLTVIKSVEKKRDVPHIHKGLVLYHIGISQINQSNFDEGIPNILAAYEEDKITYGEENAKKYFAFHFNKDFVENLSEFVDRNFFNEMKKTLASDKNLAGKSLKDLVVKFDESEKLFFAKTINSKLINKFSENLYTRVILWDNLRNLCLLLEIYLKRRKSSTRMLGGLVPLAFQNENWLKIYQNHNTGTKDANDYTHYRSPTDFSQKVQNLLSGGLFIKNAETDFLARVFLLSVLVRNFTAHNFDEYEQLLADENLYEGVFKYVLFSLLYTLHFLN